MRFTLPTVTALNRYWSPPSFESGPFHILELGEGPAR